MTMVFVKNLGSIRIIEATVGEIQDAFQRWELQRREQGLSTTEDTHAPFAVAQQDTITFLGLLGVIPETNEEVEDWMMLERRMKAMRESITVHCTRCGQALDAHADVDKMEFGDEGHHDGTRVTVYWKADSIEHVCPKPEVKRIPGEE